MTPLPPHTSTPTPTIRVYGRGFLGGRLAGSLPGATLGDVDVADYAAVLADLRERRPAVVVNAAGKTGRPNVDWCETHRAETHRSNVTGALVVARAAAEVGAHVLHLGSGCVFSGAAPRPSGFREDDPANPTSYYAETKYEADRALRDMPHVTVLRLRMPVDGAPGARNLITKLAGYREVIDVENSVTVVDDLVGVVGRLAELRPPGIFHATNPGTVRHRDLIDLYRRYVAPDHSCAFIEASELVPRGHAVRPRSSCVLDTSKLAALGVRMRPVGDAVILAMSRYRGAP